MSLDPGTRLGPYEILSAIGAGGMGEVYKARDTRLKREVAIKILPESFASDPDRLARFQREAEVLASLNHPNIAGIYGLEETDGVSALVIELVEGETLADRIAGGSIPIDEALPIARQIAEGLEAAHEQGVIHRDLKPANIKIRSDGTVKVLDFGLAKLAEATPTAVAGVAQSPLSMSPTITSPAMTGIGVLLGTAAYMSPEQARGRTVDKRADIWAFGCVLYEMLTGKRAFQGEDVADTLANVLKLTPDWSALPSDLPSPVRTLISACLEKDTRQRIGDVSAVLFVLQRRADLLEASPRSVPTGTWPAWTRAVVAVSLLIATVSVATVLRLMKGSDAPPTARFAIQAPEETTFQTGGRPGTSAAISPDGKAFAFTARSASGQLVLWVRPTDSLVARPLAATDDAAFPFWSPDSRFIGYFAHDNLLKIAAAGGPPQTLCPARAARGGTWSRNGDILFGANDGPLYRVSSAGGQPTAVTRIEKPFQDHRFPSFLPDGRHVLFYAVGPQDRSGVYIASLDTGEPRRLIQAESGAVYDVHSRHLLFNRQGTLLAQSFDATSLALMGEAFPVAENVEATVYGGDVSFSVSDAGTLIYGVGSAGRFAEVQPVWVDRQGKVVASVKAPAGGLADPRISPDGRRIAFRTASSVTNENNDIWVMDLQAGTTTRQTFDVGQDETPVWSPDGVWLAYGATRGNSRVVFRRRSDGSANDEVLWKAPLPFHAHVQDWPSKTGAVVIAMDQKDEAPSTIAVLTGGSPPTAVLEGAIDGRVSPDGRWIAYVSIESGRQEVYVQPFRSRGGKWQISTDGGTEPV